MASKNTNIVSKTLVESYIRKQVKALKQSPTETIDTLTKQLLDKPKGSLEKYLLHITPEKLQDTQSGYYKLFHVYHWLFIFLLHNSYLLQIHRPNHGSRFLLGPFLSITFIDTLASFFDMLPWESTAAI